MRFCIVIVLLTTIYGCSATKNQVDFVGSHQQDTVLVYFLQPTNLYLIDVTENTITKKSEVQIFKSVNKDLIQRLYERLVLNIQSQPLNDWNSIDGRVMVQFKTEEGEQNILFNKFGYFQSNQIVFTKDLVVKQLLQSTFPEILFIEDVVNVDSLNFQK